MNVAANISSGHRLAQDLILERVKIEVAMRRIYDLTGSVDAVSETSAACLLSVIAGLREEGVALEGWSA